jgi:hypothetical protein
MKILPMKFLSALQKGIQTVIAETRKPDAFHVGEKFEDYVRQEIFTDNYYKLLDRTHNYNANRRDFAESSLNPDFKLFDKKHRKEFWLEVKFRSQEKSSITWCDEKQLHRYQAYHRQLPTFLLLGVGNKADVPDSLYLLSMSQARYTRLFSSLLKKFEIPFDKPISPELLWNR